MRSDLRKKVLDAIQSHALVSSGARVVVAVSGGADSMALLDVLHALSAELSLDLVVAHFNHLLRESASDGDEAFVQTVAGRYGLPLHSKRADAALAAKRHGTSVEEAARNDRYTFFRDVADDAGADAIAVAHHADDQAETFLLRLLRGAGTDGLGAMSWKNALGVIRPFLGVSRDDIRRYIDEHGLDYRNDASNSEMYYQRNRVRHELLPLLKTYNPAIVSLLCSSADILAADAAALEDLLAPYRTKLLVLKDRTAEIDAARLSHELPGVRLRLYRAAFSAAAGNLRRLSNIHLQEVDRLVMRGDTGKSLDLPDGLVVRLAYGKLTVTIKDDPEEDVLPVTIPQQGVYTFGNFTIAVDVVLLPDGPLKLGTDSGSQTFQFDAGCLQFPLCLRGFRPGDRFEPFGMHGHMKLKDFFINNKIDRRARKNLPLVVDTRDTILLVGDIRRSGFGPVTAATREVLRVNVRRRKP